MTVPGIEIFVGFLTSLCAKWAPQNAPKTGNAAWRKASLWAWPRSRNAGAKLPSNPRFEGLVCHLMRVRNAACDKLAEAQEKRNGGYGKIKGNGVWRAQPVVCTSFFAGRGVEARGA